MKKLGVAICGGDEKTAWHHLRAYRGLEIAEVKSIYFDNAPATMARADAWSLRPCTSFEDILSDPNIDIIEILSSFKERDERALAALSAGKNVLIAPPFASNRVAAKKLATAARGSSAKIMCCDNLAFYPPSRKLISLAAKKIVGRVTAGRFRSIIAGKGGWDSYLTPDFKQIYPDPETIDFDALVRRELYEKLSLSYSILGPVEEIYFINPFKECSNGASAVATWKNRAFATYGCLEISYCPGMEIRSAYDPRDDNFELTGPGGIIWMTRTAAQMRTEPTIRVYRGENLFAYGNLDDEWQRGYDLAIAHFADCVTGSTKPAIDPMVSADIVGYIDAAFGSSEFNRRVKCG